MNAAANNNNNSNSNNNFAINKPRKNVNMFFFWSDKLIFAEKTPKSYFSFFEKNIFNPPLR